MDEKQEIIQVLNPSIAKMLNQEGEPFPNQITILQEKMKHVTGRLLWKFKSFPSSSIILVATITPVFPNRNQSKSFQALPQNTRDNNPMIIFLRRRI